MSLLLRTITDVDRHLPERAYPHELDVDLLQDMGGLPWLSGRLNVAAPRPLRLVLRVHNRAGIPIIEGQSNLEAGQQEFTFSDIRPLGIDGYAHAREAEREQVARRVWSRCAYGTLTVVSVLA